MRGDDTVIEKNCRSDIKKDAINNIRRKRKPHERRQVYPQNRRSKRNDERKTAVKPAMSLHVPRDGSLRGSFVHVQHSTVSVKVKNNKISTRRPWWAQTTLEENGESLKFASKSYRDSPNQRSIHLNSRNVARTRFRDSTRRVQKNHFGRRRLGILSRGLVNGTHTNRTEEPTCGISGILLEHAQREIPRPPISNAACETGALDALSFDRSPATGPSRTGSSVTPSSSKVTHALGSGNCESPQPLSSD